jgi:hypothetical protein
VVDLSFFPSPAFAQSREEMSYEVATFFFLVVARKFSVNVARRQGQAFSSSSAHLNVLRFSLFSSSERKLGRVYGRGTTFFGYSPSPFLSSGFVGGEHHALLERHLLERRYELLARAIWFACVCLFTFFRGRVGSGVKEVLQNVRPGRCVWGWGAGFLASDRVDAGQPDDKPFVIDDSNAVASFLSGKDVTQWGLLLDDSISLRTFTFSLLF